MSSAARKAHSAFPTRGLSEAFVLFQKRMKFCGSKAFEHSLYPFSFSNLWFFLFFSATIGVVLRYLCTKQGEHYETMDEFDFSWSAYGWL